MKGMQGLIVAAVLGILAAGLNWLYLENKTKDVKTEMFIGVKRDVMIKAGAVIEESQLEAVPIPEIRARRLRDYAYLYKDLDTVVGVRAARQIEGGELLLREDYRTPPTSLDLEPDERLIWIPVDSKSFVPALVDPGDQITFILPTFRSPQPSASEAGSPRDVRDGSEMIGPFTIGSMGNRLGTSDVMKASRTSLVQERSIGIIVKEEGNKFEARAMKLLDALNRNNNRNVSVALHPRK